MTNPEYMRAWKARNKAKVAASAKNYKARHPEMVKKSAIAATKKWRQKHPEKWKTLRHAQRARTVPRYYARTKGLDTLRFTRWCEVDKCVLLESKLSNFELAKQLGRSIRAVQHMRARLLEQEAAQ